MSTTAKHFDALQKSMFSYDVDGVTLFAIIGQIQLASRHPANIGPSATLVQNWARDMQKAIAEVFPDLHIIIEMGWNPEMDVDA